MSIRDLRTFLAISEGGSFAAAARTVRRTQSAVTVQMHALEEEVGATLFDRSRRPPLLNEAGRALVPRAREAVEAYDRLFDRAGDATVEGHLRLGAVPSVVTGVLPRALVAMRSRYPALHVELAMGPSKDLVERLERGLLDAVIVSDLLEGGAGLAWSPFCREPLVLIAPPDSPARKAEELIASYPFIRYNRQAWVGQLIDRLLKRRRLKPAESMTLDTLEAVTAMVHHGLGVSVVPLRTGGAPPALPVRTVPFSGSATHRVLGVVHPPSHPKAGLAEVLIAALKEAEESHDEPLAGRRRKGRGPPASSSKKTEASV
ncbi:LysR family transcriptional regulator [uncultured Enterovirga sp.]|uniref:LysR family transcriptional regulator n=1 Tax=uncultured Enterovirga sp. TaxID=2026352 RepID=UPI0035CC0FA4